MDKQDLRLLNLLSFVAGWISLAINYVPEGEGYSPRNMGYQYLVEIDQELNDRFGPDWEKYVGA